MFEPRLESLVVRGIDLAWAKGFSTIAVHALWQRGAHALAQRIASTLSPVERQARLGWMTDVAPCSLEVRGDAEAELLGAHAARSGLDAVLALLAQLGDDKHQLAVPARAVAVIVEPRLRDALRGDVVAAASAPLDEEYFSYGAVHGDHDGELGRHLGAAACADDPDIALGVLLEKIAHFAVVDARAYADAALQALGSPDGIAHARSRADKACADVMQPRERRWAASYLASACHKLAAAGASDQVHAIVTRLEDAWGPPRGWPIEPDLAAQILCAGRRIDDAYKLELTRDVRVTIAFAAALVREGNVALAGERLDEMLERPCLVTRRYLPSVYVDDKVRSDVAKLGVTCAELLALARIAIAIDPDALVRMRERFATATAALSTTIDA